MDELTPFDERGNLIQVETVEDFTFTVIFDTELDPEEVNILYPDPVDYRTLDKDQVDRILKQQINKVTLQTSIVYKPDKFGRIRMEKFTQTLLEDGDIALDYDEHHEMHPELVTHADQLEQAKEADGEKEVSEDEENLTEEQLTGSFLYYSFILCVIGLLVKQICETLLKKLK